MTYVDHTRPPFVDISLPEAITVPVVLLILFYAVVLSIDFYILRHEQHFNKVISPTQLRIGMAIIHAILPLIFISSHPPINILFAAAPWLVLCYTASMPTKELTFEKWIGALIQITVNQNSLQNDSRKIRYKGISKVALGIFKLVFMHVVTDPLLPTHTEYALAYSWLHPMSLIYTLLFGIKAYCLLGAIDVVMGAEQTLFGWDMIDLFNSPILASSPRDFWSRRWNKIVRNLLHTQVFKKAEKAKEDATVKEKGNDVIVTHGRTGSSFWTSAPGRGLLAFLVSGAFHEVIIMSVCRKITLENFLFFTLQGVAVMIEVKLRQGALKQEPKGKTRVICILIQLTFMTLTSRLFLGPFLRYDFF